MSAPLTEEDILIWSKKLNITPDELIAALRRQKAHGDAFGAALLSFSLTCISFLIVLLIISTVGKNIN